MMLVIGITFPLEAGAGNYSFEVAKLPRNWKSWVMRQFPYGTDFAGCQFFKVKD